MVDRDPAATFQRKLPCRKCGGAFFRLLSPARYRIPPLSGKLRQAGAPGGNKPERGVQFSITRRG